MSIWTFAKSNNISIISVWFFFCIISIKNYFPERKPKAIKFDTTPGDQYSRLYSEEMIAMMEELRLPRYGSIYSW